MRHRIIEPHKLPPDLEAWGWRMQQVKAGSRKHPGGWWQFIFWRIHGLAKGDEPLDLQRDSLRVKVRRPTQAETLAEATREMRMRSAPLEKSADYRRLMDQERKMWEDHLARSMSMKHPPGDEP